LYLIWLEEFGFDDDLELMLIPDFFEGFCFVERLVTFLVQKCLMIDILISFVEQVI